MASHVLVSDWLRDELARKPWHVAISAFLSLKTVGFRVILELEPEILNKNPNPIPNRPVLSPALVIARTKHPVDGVDS